MHRIQEIVSEYPGKSMYYIAREMNISDATTRKTVAKKLYTHVLRRGQFMMQQTKTLKKLRN